MDSNTTPLAGAQGDVLPDGWYEWRLCDREIYIGYTYVNGGRVDKGRGPSVATCLENGDTFDPAVVLTVAEHDALIARVAQLEVQLKETVAYVGDSDTMFLELTAENRRLTALVDEAGEWEVVPHVMPFNAQGDYLSGTGQGLCIWLQCTMANAVWHGVPLGENMQLRRKKETPHAE